MRSQERDIEIVAFADPGAGKERHLGRPVYHRADGAADAEAYLVTDLGNPADAYERLCGQVEESRVLVPGILEWRPEQAAGAD